MQVGAHHARDSRWRQRFTAAALAVCLLWTCAGRALAANQVTAEELKAHMDQLVRDIRDKQTVNGSWSSERVLGAGRWVVGQTALAVLALSSAGLPADDAAIKNGVEFLLNRNAASVYEAALKIMALESVDHKQYIKEIERTVEYLILTQCDNGGWSYSGSVSRPDNSNSQFAVLGLRSAARSGAKIPDSVWAGAYAYFARGQHGKDGGWGYTQGDNDSYGSMTVAGAASLYICSVRLHLSEGVCCKYIDDNRMDRGLNWLARHFSVRTNPGYNSWKFYYLYGLERAGVISARRYMGKHDWYLEGVDHLVHTQNVYAGLGDWVGPIVRKSFALLFLAKGNSHVLLHKARWAGGWNGYRYDAKFLVEHFGDLLDQRLAWQILPLDAPFDHLKSAPILYISGRGRLMWSEKERTNLKDFIETGGFVLVEANAGDKAFDESFRALMKAHFPDQELAPLEKTHPLYTAHFNLPETGRVRLWAVKGPCWMSMLYAPDGISCSWDVDQRDHSHFKLGINILAYVTGMEKQESKLAMQEKPVAKPQIEKKAAKLSGAFVVGQLVHKGNWKPHGTVWPRILSKANKEAGLGLFSAPVAINPEEGSLFKAHLLNIIGTKRFRLTEQTKEKLRRYVERGGFIFAEAACGSPEFDEAFRQLVGELFPGAQFEQVPPGHPLWKLGRPLDKVRYSAAVTRREPDLKRPILEFVEVDGRIVLIYSKFDLSSAIAGHPCFNCPAVLEPSASELILKVVLYSLTS